MSRYQEDQYQENFVSNRPNDAQNYPYVFFNQVSGQDPNPNPMAVSSGAAGFCASTRTVHGMPDDALEKKCNALDVNVCASTQCCVLLGTSKCVAGNANGPTNTTGYYDPALVNKDRYYYQGKCYGNCTNQQSTDSQWTDTTNAATYYHLQDFAKDGYAAPSMPGSGSPVSGMTGSGSPVSGMPGSGSPVSGMTGWLGSGSALFSTAATNYGGGGGYYASNITNSPGSQLNGVNSASIQNGGAAAAGMVPSSSSQCSSPHTDKEQRELTNIFRAIGMYLFYNQPFPTILMDSGHSTTPSPTLSTMPPLSSTPNPIPSTPIA
jgi:hypothetical protein